MRWWKAGKTQPNPTQHNCDEVAPHVHHFLEIVIFRRFRRFRSSGWNVKNWAREDEKEPLPVVVGTIENYKLASLLVQNLEDTSVERPGVSSKLIFASCVSNIRSRALGGVHVLVKGIVR